MADTTWDILESQSSLTTGTPSAWQHLNAQLATTVTVSCQQKLMDYSETYTLQLEPDYILTIEDDFALTLECP